VPPARATSVAAGIEHAAKELGRRPARDELEIATWLAGLLGAELSAGQAFAALQELQSIARSVHRFFDQYDILLTPTLGARSASSAAPGVEEVAKCRQRLWRPLPNPRD
jgi:amidase